MEREPTHVLLADKNSLVRAGLTALVLGDPGLKLVGAVREGAAFLSRLESEPVEVGVIGWDLPDMTGGEVLKALRKSASPVRVIVYSGENSPEVIRRAVRLGAWGYLSKREEPEVLIETVHAVARGRMSLPYMDLAQLHDDPLRSLTNRERELLAALAKGWSNHQIAARTGISENTVKYHLKNLYDKLGVTNRAMAVARYLAEARED